MTSMYFEKWRIFQPVIRIVFWGVTIRGFEKRKKGHPQAVQNLLLVLCFHKLAALDIYLFKYEMGNDNERLIEG